MALTLLVSQEDFRAFVPVDANLQWSQQVQAAVNSAQASYIRTAVCPKLYDELLLQVATDTITVPNEALLRYVAPVLAWYAYADLLPYKQQTFAESGPSNFTGQNLTPAPQEQIYPVQRMARDKAKVFEAQLVEYLQDNRTEYPLYDCCGNGVNRQGSRMRMI